MTINWDGKGLPPVGAEVEAMMAGAPGENWRWRRVKVALSGIEGAERECLVYDVESTKPAWVDTFRPVSQHQKMRDEAGAAIYKAINWNSDGEWASPSRMEDYKKAYDAIAAGKIPGVKLDDL